MNLETLSFQDTSICKIFLQTKNVYLEKKEFPNLCLYDFFSSLGVKYDTNQRLVTKF